MPNICGSSVRNLFLGTVLVARISKWLLDSWKFVQLIEYTILLAAIHGYRPKSKETDANICGSSVRNLFLGTVLVAKISKWFLDSWKFVQLIEYTIILAAIHGYRSKSKETEARQQ